MQDPSLLAAWNERRHAMGHEQARALPEAKTRKARKTQAEFRALRGFARALREYLAKAQSRCAPVMASAQPLTAVAVGRRRMRGISRG